MKKRLFLSLLFIIIIFTLVLSSCQPKEGFVFVGGEKTMINLPQDEISKELLEKYKPRIFIHEESYEPIDFYRDYLPYTTLSCHNKNVKIDSPSRADLKEYHLDRGCSLDLQKSKETYLKRENQVEPSIYGRVYQDKIGSKDYIILKYNLVFPYSGLPAKTSKVKTALASTINDPRAWHELDIHGAFHVVLEKDTLKPVGILFNQHNHHHSYLWDDISEGDGETHLKLGIAKDANEPYLWKGKSETIRTSGSPFDKIAYRYGRSNWGGFNSGLDYLGNKDEMVEVATKLKLLRADDPLYKSKMRLGAKEKIFGIYESGWLSGPPGMDYYTHPALNDLGKLFTFWLIDPNDDKFFRMLDETNKDFKSINLKKLIDYQTNKFIDS